MAEINNKVATSGLVTLDLADFYESGERVLFDLRPHLFQELILREKDFREFIKNNDWRIYQDKLVAIVCSADAIVPTWAYMLLSMALEPFAKTVVFGDIKAMEEYLFVEKLNRIDPEKYRDARIVVKGCGDIPVPTNAFVQIAKILRPVAKSIMYGEPCSTVPLYKAKSS